MGRGRKQKGESKLQSKGRFEDRRGISYKAYLATSDILKL